MQPAMYNIADVITSVLESGQVRINIGNAKTGKGVASSVALWGVDGFYSRPNDASSDGAAQVLYFVHGDAKIPIAARDNRPILNYGELQPGDRVICTDSSAFYALKKGDNAHVLYTTNDTGDDKPMLVNLSGAKGTYTVLIDGTDGPTVIQAKSGEITLGVDGGGSITINKQGVFVFGPYCGLNTGKGNLGVIGAIAPPPTNGIAYSVAGPVNLISTSWVVGI